MKHALLALAILIAAPLHAQGALSVDRVFADESAGIALADAKAVAAAAVESARYRFIPFFSDNVPDSPAVALQFIFTGTPAMVAVKATLVSGREEQVVLYWSGRAELDILLPPLVFSLWARMAGLADRWRAEAPLPGAEFSVVSGGPLLDIDETIPQYYAAMSPSPGGGVFVSGVGFLAELGPDLAVKGTYRPDPANPYAYMYGLASTSSGTVVGMTSTGEVWTLKRGTAGFERGGSIQPLPSSFRLAPDGSPTFQDYSSMGFFRLSGRRKVSMDLHGSKPVTMASFDFDEDGNFWYYDLLSRIVRMYAPDGVLLQAIRLLDGPGKDMTAQRMHVRGSEILLVSGQSVAAFDRFGLPLWRIDEPVPQSDPLAGSTINGSAVGSDGSLYLLLSGGGLTITRFDDARSLDALRAGGAESLASSLERVISLNSAVGADPENEAAYGTRADFVQAAGLSGVELTLRSAMAAAYPGNAHNSARLMELRSGIMRSAALRAADAVYAPLQKYGAETARADYQKAMRALERFLGNHPGDATVSQAMSALGNAFRAREGGAVPSRPAPLGVEARFGPIFPAFMERYRAVPAGTIRVTNRGDSEVTGLKVTVAIKDFLDFPAEAVIPGSLAAGASIEVPIVLILNRSVLELREETTVAAMVRAEANGAEGGQAASVLFRARTALTWTDTAALAAFVTPNDDAIVTFVHASLFMEPPPLFGRSFSRAFALVNALGARGLVYAEDPATPFSAAGDGSVIDTVRFPRSTLASGAGDCDDTTALLASCLEAAGVRTAILTSPGHVFLAFEADGAPGGTGRYGSPPSAYGALESQGVWWIPLESTVLSKGFAEAWRQGYATAARAGKTLAIVPIEQARKAYPALPLPGTPGEPPLPSPAVYGTLSQAVVAALKSVYVGPTRTAVTAAASGRARADAWNDLGVRLVQFGEYGEAVKAFGEAGKEDPRYAAPRINLVTALGLAGDAAEAAAALVKALADFPGSASIKGFAERYGAMAPVLAAGGGQAGSGSRSAGAGPVELDWGD